MNDSIRRYNLRLVRQSGDMKEGLEQYLNGLGHEEDFVAVTSSASKGNRVNGIEEKQQRREIKAIFVGTRRSDPHGGEYILIGCFYEKRSVDKPVLPIFLAHSGPHASEEDRSRMARGGAYSADLRLVVSRRMALSALSTFCRQT